MEGPQVPLFLLEPGKLPAEEQREADLHHLRRADGHRQERKIEPGPVAAPLHAKGREQQQNKAYIEKGHQLPPLHQHFQVHHGKGDIHDDAKDQRCQLDQNVALGFFVPGGAENEQDAIERSGAAKPQQHQVRLLEEVREDSFKSLDHGNLPFVKLLFSFVV